MSPNSGEDSNDENSTLDDLAEFARLNQMPIFSLTVENNLKRPSQYILCIEQPLWFLSKEYYRDRKVVSAYKSFMEKVLRLFGADLNPDFNQDLEDIFELELQFAEVRR